MRNFPNWAIVLGLFVLALFMLRMGEAIPALFVFLLGIATPIIQDIREYVKKGADKKTSRLKMSEAEAREVLGVSASADAEEIKAAYLKLIKKNHPDKGGSKYLAAKITEAKKVLLGK